MSALRGPLDGARIALVMLTLAACDSLTVRGCT